MNETCKLQWTPLEDVTSYDVTCHTSPIKGTVTGKPERIFAAKVIDLNGAPHYFEVPESQWRLVIKQLQEIVGDAE